MVKKLRWFLVFMFLFFPMVAWGDFEPGSGGGSGDLLSTNNLSDVASTAVARTNLGLAKGSDVQTFSTNLATYAAITPSDNTKSLLAAANYLAWRTALGVVLGSDVQSFSNNLATLALGNTAAGRTLLGLSLGSDAQAYSTFLNYMSALTATPANGVLGINATANGVEVKNSLTLSVLNMTAATSSIPQPLATLASKPSTCTVGMKWQASDTGVDYTCNATNTWTTIATGVGTGDMLKADNLSGLANYSTARTNLGLAIGSDVQAYNAAIVTLTGAQTLTNKILTAPMVQAYELTASQTMTLAATQCYGTRINNLGQTNAAVITLPTAEQGMDMIFAMGTATPGTYSIVSATNYAIWAAGASAASGVRTIPVKGDYFVFFTFKTGASTWEWIAKSGQGTLTAY